MYQPNKEVNVLHEEWTCRASSRVGTNTNTRGPVCFESMFLLVMLTLIFARAHVFVWYTPGITLAWLFSKA